MTGRTRSASSAWKPNPTQPNQNRNQRRPDSFSKTGSRRRAPAALILSAPGRVDCPPTSMMSAPSSTRVWARSSAQSTLAVYRPPSEKLLFLPPGDMDHRTNKATHSTAQRVQFVSTNAAAFDYAYLPIRRHIQNPHDRLPLRPSPQLDISSTFSSSSSSHGNHLRQAQSAFRIGVRSKAVLFNIALDCRENGLDRLASVNSGLALAKVAEGKEDKRTFVQARVRDLPSRKQPIEQSIDVPTREGGKEGRKEEREREREREKIVASARPCPCP